MSDGLAQGHKMVLAARRMLKNGSDVERVIRMLDLADASLRIARGQTVPIESIRGYQLSERRDIMVEGHHEPS